MDPVRHSVLVVDDDDVFRGRLAKALEGRGFEVRMAKDGVSAVELARDESPEYAVVDLRMPGMDGLEVVRQLHAIDDTTRIVMLTGYGSIATAVTAVRSGAINYLAKPADVDQILAALAAKGEDGKADDGSDAWEDPARVPSLARVEWEHIQRVVHECGGNISKAAKALGIHRRSLQRKLGKDPVRR